MPDQPTTTAAGWPLIENDLPPAPDPNYCIDLEAALLAHMLHPEWGYDDRDESYETALTVRIRRPFMSSDSPRTSAASEPVKITYSGLTYIVGGKAPEGLRAPVAVCEACDAVMPMTNDAMYEHAAKCPAKGWAHGV